MKKFLYTSLVTLTISVFSLYGCEQSNQEFDPPNKANLTSGSAEKLNTVGTAVKVVKKTDKMAQLWDKEALLMNINGIDIDVNGSNKQGSPSSKWIITYFSPKKDPGENGYTITFSGSGASTWLQSNGNYVVKNNISNFGVDSDKAFKAAEDAGLVKGIIYSADLVKNDKGMLWVVGTKKDEKAEKYEIKKIDAISAQPVN
jgi:hypothetical protein